MADTFEEWLKVVDRFLASRKRGVRIEELDVHILKEQYIAGVSPIESATAPDLKLARSSADKVPFTRCEIALNPVPFPEYTLTLDGTCDDARKITKAVINRSDWGIYSDGKSLIKIKRQIVEGVKLPGWDVRLEIHIEAASDTATRVSIDLGQTAMGVKPLTVGTLRDSLRLCLR